MASDDVDCADGTEASSSVALGDCDDTDGSIHPGAVDTPGDGVDQDCDGEERCWSDQDGDGYTDGQTVPTADDDCDDSGELAAGAPDGDCDDEDATRSPGATEAVGDGIDQDCAGVELCHPDGDGDGFADSDALVASTEQCAGAGETRSDTLGGDCNDADEAVNPDATEAPADGVDQDCDGGDTCFVDVDRDGWRTDETMSSGDLDCDDLHEAGADWPDGDCDDALPTVQPDATDFPGDGIDQDCDGRDAESEESSAPRSCSAMPTSPGVGVVLLGALLLRRRYRHIGVSR
ncbi:MAG: hypothetical protein GY913_02550 [Proteobacteria bacterium]|nr:hypothetical protein [Pseudomonadota bacterium]MCP4915781.1 hypothetical protein [Pseudomonadota bacterium]